MVIVGAKGFAKEVLEVLAQNGVSTGIALYDDVSDDLPSLLFGKFPVLRAESEVIEFFEAHGFEFTLGIGSPLLRLKMAEKFRNLGGKLTTIISKFAHVGRYGCDIQAGCNIMTGTVLTSDIILSEGVLINLNCTVGHDATIGRYAELSPGVHISGHAKIGDFCTIGTNATILPKVKLGNNVIVGAGSVVTKDIPDNTLVVGVPAVAKKELPPLTL